MHTYAQHDPRIERRLSCDLFFDGGRQTGMVLNVSRSGLFIQTSLSTQPGANVAIDLNGPSGESLEVDTTVVWQRVASLELTGPTRSGVGLQINRASPGYVELLESIGGRRAPAPSATAAFCRYRVRVKLQGEPRSRSLMVFAKSEQAARKQALQKAGEGWSVIDLEEQFLF